MYQHYFLFCCYVVHIKWMLKHILSFYGINIQHPCSILTVGYMECTFLHSQFIQTLWSVRHKSSCHPWETRMLTELIFLELLLLDELKVNPKFLIYRTVQLSDTEPFPKCLFFCVRAVLQTVQTVRDGYLPEEGAPALHRLCEGERSAVSANLPHTGTERDTHPERNLSPCVRSRPVYTCRHARVLTVADLQSQK